MSRNRVSRGLVAGVGAVIVIGGVAYLNKTKSTVADDKGKVAEASPAAAPVAQPAAPAKPAPKNTGQIALPGSAQAMVTQTPGVISTSVPPASPTTPAPAPAKPQAASSGAATATPAAPVVRAPKAPNNADPAVSAKAVADGKAQLDAGNLLAGRTILNDALVGGRLTDADERTAKQLIASANETLIFSPRRFSEDPFTGSYTVQNGDRPNKIGVLCSVTWDFLGRVNGIKDARRLRVGQTIKTVKGPFHAVVSKSRFEMDLYLGSPGERGSLYVRSFPVGLGRNNSTPTGSWMLQPQGKLTNPKWWGTADEPPKAADDPQNPLGEFWMGLVGTDGDALGREGFGVHGTIDPDSIGKEMSHGCIRLVHENVERVYEMLVDGKSTVIVRD